VALSHNDLIRSSNQVPILIIDNCNCESYLLATLELSGLLYFPFSATTRSVIAAPLSSTLPINRRKKSVFKVVSLHKTFVAAAVNS